MNVAKFRVINTHTSEVVTMYPIQYTDLKDLHASLNDARQVWSEHRVEAEMKDHESCLTISYGRWQEQVAWEQQLELLEDYYD